MKEEFNFQKIKAQRVNQVLHCHFQQIIDSRRSKKQVALRFKKEFSLSKMADK